MTSTPAADPDQEAYERACAQAAAGEVAAARDAFLALRARRATPAANLELQLGAAHLRLGETDAAVAALATAAALDPGLYHAHALLSRALADRGDGTRAEAALRRAEAVAPDDADAFRELRQRHAGYSRRAHA